MHQLTYKLTADHSEAKNGELWLASELLIDGKNPLMSPKYDDFDIRELFESISRANKGPVYILTCGCGAPGCAGYFDGISVETTEGVITWNDRDQNLSYCFNPGEYFATLLALYHEITQWKEKAESKGLELRVFPDWHSTKDIIEAGTYLEEGE